MVRVINDANNLKSAINDIHYLNTSIGFVPTMGALHSGHLSLVAQAKRENKFVVVSIFVNPTQFNQPQDFDHYPQTLNEDIALLSKQGFADIVFAPQADSIYPDKYLYRVTENDFSRELCGRSRPGHFDGVLTVVLKLLLLTRPTRAYFGEKDYQQFKLIAGLAEAFLLTTQIIGCPTVRDENGVALSSRNRRLNQADQVKLAEFFKVLKKTQSIDQIKEELNAYGFEVDYVEEHGGRRFGAIFFRGVRFIDNVEI